MPLALSGPALHPVTESSSTPFIGRISECPDLPEALRAHAILRVAQCPDAVPRGFRAYLIDSAPANLSVRDAFILAPAFRYLADGDIVRLDADRRTIATLYRKASPSNSFLVTERCDNRCLMCSQPPAAGDASGLVEELREVIPLVDPATKEIGITGGEPALLGDDLIILLEMMKRHLPRTAVHILSNGRRFSDPGLARALGSVGHPDLMVGVPLHSDLPEEHDYVAQCRGAFDEAVRGILNLKRAGLRVEVRFVIHAQTNGRLPAFAAFMARNLRFVDHVALMGIELVGFALTNLDLLWIDPADYQTELAHAVSNLRRAGMSTSIYNLPLCILPPELHAFARKSISDWKNVYCDECRPCLRRSDCCGFFASGSIRQPRGIRAFT